MDSLAKRLEGMSLEKRAYALNMPIHFAQARDLAKLERVLTDYEFIEVKASFGVVFELLQDYAFVEGLWPDKSKNEQDERRRQVIQQYFELLLAHSHAPEQNPFPPVPSSEAIVTPSPRVEPAGVVNGVEHVRCWGQFVGRHTQAIRQRAAPLFQLAYNSAAAGPVAQDVEQRLKGSSSPTDPWLRLVNRPRFSSDAGLVRILEGVEDFVHRVVIDSAGIVAAAGGRSGSIWIWDLITGRPMKALRGHTGAITALTAAFDLAQVISGSEDGTIRVWDTFDGVCLAVLEGHDDRVRSVAVTPVGNLAVSSGDNTIRIWDLAKNKCIARLDSQTASAVTITADGRRMVLAGSTSADPSISIWDVQAQGPLARLKGHQAGLFSIAITPDGRRAVSGSYDQQIGVWDLTTFQCLGLYHGHSAWVGAVAITPDGRLAVSGSGDGSLRFWDLDTGKSIVLKGHMRPIDSVAIAADGRYCLSAASEGGLRLWNLASNDLSARKNAGMTILKGTPDLEKRVCLSGEGRLSVHRGDSEMMLTGKEMTLGGAELARTTSDISRGISSHDDGTVCIWDFNRGDLVRRIENEEKVRAMAIVPGTSDAWVVRKNWSIERWNLRSGDCLGHLALKGHPFEAFHMLTPDSRCLVLADRDHSIRFLDLEANDITKMFRGHKGYVSTVVLLPDGQRMISESLDHTLRIWDVAGECCVHLVEGIDGQATLALSPDCQHMALGDGFDIKVLRPSDGETLHILAGHRHSVRSLLFSADGQYLITCALDDTMRIWCVRSGQCIAAYASDAGVMWPKIIAWPYIIANTGSDKPSILRLENAPPLGHPIISARRLWQFGEHGKSGSWDEDLTAVCYWCGRAFPVDKLMIGRVIGCPVDDCNKELALSDLLYDQYSP